MFKLLVPFLFTFLINLNSCLVKICGHTSHVERFIQSWMECLVHSLIHFLHWLLGFCLCRSNYHCRWDLRSYCCCTRAFAPVAICKRATKARLSETIQAGVLYYWLLFSRRRLGYLVILLFCFRRGWWRHIVIRLIFAINNVSLPFFAVVHRWWWFALVSLFSACDKADEITHHAKDPSSLNRGSHQGLDFRLSFGFLWLYFGFFYYRLHYLLPWRLRNFFLPVIDIWLLYWGLDQCSGGFFNTSTVLWLFSMRSNDRLLDIWLYLNFFILWLARELGYEWLLYLLLFRRLLRRV